MKSGDRVWVLLPKNAVGVTDDMRVLNESKQVIKETHVVVRGKSQVGVMYSLEGCTSHFGQPYWFVEEWLTPMVERAEQ